MSDSREKLQALVEKWRKQAIESREEAGRIRRTVYVPTEAEVNCNIRAEVWDKCADELEALLAAQGAKLATECPEAETVAIGAGDSIAGSQSLQEILAERKRFLIAKNAAAPPVQGAPLHNDLGASGTANTESDAKDGQPLSTPCRELGVDAPKQPVQGAGTPPQDDALRVGYRKGWDTLATMIRAHFPDFDDAHLCQWADKMLAAHQSPVEALRPVLENLVAHAPENCGNPECDCLHYKTALEDARRALAAQEKPPAQRLSGPPPSDPFHISKIPDMLRRLANEYETECCELDCDDLRSAANVVALAGSPAQPSKGGEK